MSLGRKNRLYISQNDVRVSSNALHSLNNNDFLKKKKKIKYFKYWKALQPETCRVMHIQHQFLPSIFQTQIVLGSQTWNTLDGIFINFLYTVVAGPFYNVTSFTAFWFIKKKHYILRSSALLFSAHICNSSHHREPLSTGHVLASFLCYVVCLSQQPESDWWREHGEVIMMMGF